MNPNPPKKILLTIAAIEGIQPPETGRVYVYDLRVPGLAICVTDHGVRTFYWSGRLAGRPKRIRIGAYPVVKIDEARREALKIGGQKAMGNDAVDTRQAIKQEHTLGQLWDHYLEHRAKPTKRSWERDVKTWERDLEQWKHRRLSAITPADIQGVMTKLFNSKGPGAANKAFELLQSMYSHARQPLRWVTDSPTLGLKRYKIQPRERFLQEGELVRFFEALAGLRRDTPRHFFMLCLLTGARRSNVASMRWDELDLYAETWRIPHAKQKSKVSVTIALVPEAVALLQGRRNDSPWVFPGQGKSAHYSEPKDAWKRLLTAAKIENLRIHDLRRTLGSWQAMGGASLQIIGKSLGHQSTSSTAVYSRLQLDPIRASVAKATAAILAAGKSEKSSEKTPERQSGDT